MVECFTWLSSNHRNILILFWHVFWLTDELSTCVNIRLNTRARIFIVFNVVSYLFTLILASEFSWAHLVSVSNFLYFPVVKVYTWLSASPFFCVGDICCWQFLVIKGKLNAASGKVFIAYFSCFPYRSPGEQDFWLSYQYFHNSYQPSAKKRRIGMHG